MIVKNKYAVDFAYILGTNGLGKQFENIEEFYQMIRADFPINKDSIEVGMAHSEDLEKLKPYMLSVTPIIGASEILFQNISDKTLTEEEIKYFNDAGLCNFADEKFKQYESMSLVAIENEDNPYYQEFKVAKLDELNILGYYHIDDASRDLSKLEKFKTIISNMNGISNYNE